MSDNGGIVVVVGVWWYLGWREVVIPASWRKWSAIKYSRVGSSSRAEQSRFAATNN